VREVDSGESEPRQGDWLPDVRRIIVLGVDGGTEYVETSLGVVVLTQCCDLARGGTGVASVAPVIELGSAEASRERRGRSRFVPVPDAGNNRFVDIGSLGSMTHEAVALERRTSVVDAAERPKFGERVARRFSRFAYPDEAQPLIKWLVQSINKKADSADSPMGQLLQRVQRIRLEIAGDWDRPPWDVTVLVILHAGQLPTPDGPPEQEADPPTDFNALLRKLIDTTPGSSDCEPLWRRFEELYAAKAAAGAGLDSSLLSSVVVEVLEEVDLTYARFRASAPLDTDHVSGPLLDD